MAKQNYGTGHEVFMGMGGWPARGSGVRRHSVSDLAPRSPCREASFDGGGPGRHAELDTHMLLKEIRNMVREEFDTRFRVNISGYPAGAASAFAREAKERPHSASSQRDSQLYANVVKPQDDPQTVLNKMEEAKKDAALLMFDSDKLYSAVGLLPAVLKAIEETKNSIKEAKVDIELIKTATADMDLIKKATAGLHLRPASEQIQAPQLDDTPLIDTAALLQGVQDVNNEIKTVITDINRKSVGEIIRACQADVSPLTSEIQAVLQGLREAKNEVKQAISEINLKPVVEQTQALQVLDITSLTDEILNLPRKIDFNAVLQGIQAAKDEVKKAITEIDFSFLIEQIEAVLTANRMVKVPTAEIEEVNQVDKSLSESQVSLVRTLDVSALLTLDKEILNCCGICDAECKLWVYRTPPLEPGDTEWVVYLTANKVQVPNYAQPVHGRVSCSDNAFLRFPGGAQEKRITLDGSSDGDCKASKPFDLIRIRGGDNDSETCALANLVFDLAPFGDFTFKPSQDVANSYNRKKKCVLPALLRGPMSVGTYVG